MSTFGDIERAFADLYEYRWAIGAAVLVFIAAVLAFAYWRGWHQVIWRHRLPFGIAAVPLLALTIWLGWSLGSPLFTNVTVEEEFPFAVNAIVPEGMEMAEVERVMAGMAMVDTPVMQETMPGPSSINAGSLLEAGVPITAMTNEDVTALEKGFQMVSQVGDTSMVDEGARMMEPVVAANMDQQGEVRRVKTGNFKDADSFHKGSGEATIFAAPGGGHLLRLEDFAVTNGPALHVILSPHPDPTRSEEVKQGGYVDLGPLKGNRGNQNYPVPAGVDVSPINSVVIYCKPFSVVFSVATLQTP